MNKLVGIFILIYGAALFSTSGNMNKTLAEFSGQAIIKVRPDFISLMLTVKSECYLAPLDAQSATDEVVSKIDAYLKTLQQKSDTHFKIMVDGGYTTTFSRWHRNMEYCRNTFQKNTNITIKMSARKDFDKIFSGIQTFVLRQFEQSQFLEGSDMARTFVIVGMPNPELAPRHKRNLERKAYDIALRDAKENFKSAISSCEPHHPKIHSIREVGNSEMPRPLAGARFHMLTADAMAEKTVAPVSFDDLEVSKTLLVNFEFDGTVCFTKTK
jgi:uncharacterized protein YggE